ncbi:SDR family NAD(P)-dependent oxidoreductase [Amycolatopsis sp. RM579]|uniref:SDR family NAD(P)-dependent oxidoreductase n=1 Tax=Amycolatopsis pithecellobii TaxID=664692 RepID=A0A6N7YU24_9PSEU|nr:SDR family NAD(P)-dependent oxidoreductase [Amycolatopsis pithecellobii]
MIERKYGRIITTASGMGRTGTHTMANYVASKWGAHRLGQNRGQGAGAARDHRQRDQSWHGGHQAHSKRDDEAPGQPWRGEPDRRGCRPDHPGNRNAPPALSADTGYPANHT